MEVKKNQVFLVSGQQIIQGEAADGKVVQCIVVAPSEPEVAAVLTKQNPSFQILGMASLEDYEKAAQSIRSALKGEAKALPMFVGKDMAH